MEGNRMAMKHGEKPASHPAPVISGWFGGCKNGSDPCKKTKKILNLLVFQMVEEKIG